MPTAVAYDAVDEAPAVAPSLLEPLETTTTTTAAIPVITTMRATTPVKSKATKASKAKAKATKATTTVKSKPKATKKRAATSTTASTAAKKGKTTTTKMSKLPGQLTLGAFFGGAPRKVTPTASIQASVRDLDPARRAELQTIVLGKLFVSRSQSSSTSDEAAVTVEANESSVAAAETVRRVSTSPLPPVEHDDKEAETPAVARVLPTEDVAELPAAALPHPDASVEEDVPQEAVVNEHSIEPALELPEPAVPVADPSLEASVVVPTEGTLPDAPLEDSERNVAPEVEETKVPELPVAQVLLAPPSPIRVSAEDWGDATADADDAPAAKKSLAKKATKKAPVKKAATANAKKSEAKEPSTEPSTIATVLATDDPQRANLQNLHDTYFAQATTLFASCREGLVDTVAPIDRTLADEAPASLSEAQTRLALLIEGRSEALEKLAVDVAPHVESQFATVEAVREQIKVLAKRQALVKDVVRKVLVGKAAQATAPVNLFEDESPDRLWQWQVQVLDLLPNKAVKTHRIKIRKQVYHLHNLVAVLQTLNVLLEAAVSDRPSLLAKLSRQEEKVLQYQREQAKAVIAQHLKETQRQEKEKLKMAQKETAEADKKKAAEAKKEAAAAKKEAEAAAKAKKQAELEAQKDAKAKEKEEKARKAEQEKEELEQKKKTLLQRQQNKMLSFFKPGMAPKKKKVVEKKVEAAVPTPAAPKMVESIGTDFDVDTFRSQINSYAHDASVPFRSLSETARKSRRRRSRKVQLSVYVTVGSDNPWEDGRPYADLQQVTVRNRFKFLSFHEDVRPAYHGTWSKKSHTVKGRAPFAKDRAVFDYDYDSEVEWEEGDNEVGEDIGNDVDDEEEKEEEDGDGDEDGWLAADDDLDDEPDEETKLLRQRLVHQEDGTTERVAILIAPVSGVSLSLSTAKAATFVDGIEVDDAAQLLASHTSCFVNDFDMYLDAFPPDLMDENLLPVSPSESKEMSMADMQAFLRFIHNNSCASKEKLIDDLRTALPEVTSSRALAMRTLELVAEKQKHPIKGFIWEVKRDVLEKHELSDLLTNSVEDPDTAKKHVLRTIAKYVHHSTQSKQKLLDELQAEYASILLSRAETMRHVDAVAEKHRNPKGGVYWEVTESAKLDLGLDRLPLNPPTPSVVERAPSSSTKKRQRSEAKRDIGAEYQQADPAAPVIVESTAPSTGATESPKKPKLCEPTDA
jgi:hypothetical protein